MRRAGAGPDGGKTDKGAIVDLGISGRRALVLGGNRGIGYGIAKALVAEGVNVAIAARDADRLRSAAAELQATGLADVTTAQIDLARTDDIATSAASLTERFGPIDILINNNRRASLWRRSRPAARRMAQPLRGHGAERDRAHRLPAARHARTALGPHSHGDLVRRHPADPNSGDLQQPARVAGRLVEDIVGRGRGRRSHRDVLVPGRIDTERVRLTDESDRAEGQDFRGRGGSPLSHDDSDRSLRHGR